MKKSFKAQRRSNLSTDFFDSVLYRIQAAHCGTEQ